MAVSRALIDRLLDALAWLVGHGLLRTVEVVGAQRVPRDRPVIIVANHFNGLFDAVLLAIIVRGVPRFLAKATLWRSPLLRPLLALAGLVPVYRPEDAVLPVGTFASRETRAEASAESPPVDNVATFARANKMLRRHATLAIFPEGTTHDRLELARVRTGAARIALGAHADGVRGVTIVPIGLTFDDKLALRSRVLARIGDAIDVDAWVEGEGTSASDREAVRLLTDTIRSRLSDVTPRYADVLERAILSRAAEVRLRTDLDDPGRIVPLAQREALAQRIADTPESTSNAVIAAQGAYQLRLDLVRLRDEHLMPPLQRRWLLRRALGLTAYIAVLGVVVAAGIAINVVPTLLTAAAGRRPLAPATKGTVRVLTALTVFPLTWITVAVALPITGVLPTTLAVVACPICGAVAVGGLERTVALARAWAGWLGLYNARNLLGPIHAARETVCREVDAATGGPAAAGSTAAAGRSAGPAAAAGRSAGGPSSAPTRAAAARRGRTRRSDRRQAGRPPT
jgi:glycerol-3-phosphate O-acyltransferase/dihydroxyacetone phosphate acyltransferase